MFKSNNNSNKYKNNKIKINNRKYKTNKMNN